MNLESITLGENRLVIDISNDINQATILRVEYQTK